MKSRKALVNLPLSVTDPKTHQIIKDRAISTNDFFFIQIGSNDGQTGDPIHSYIMKYHWKGILIEPIPFLFKRLKKTYENQNGLIFENIAISEKDGNKIFYRIEENHEPNNP